MTIYIALYFIIFFLAWFVKEKQSNILIVFLLLFFSMLRGVNVGTDTIHYLAGFSQREFDLSSLSVYSFEFLFIGVENLLKAFNLSTRYIIYIFSIVTFYFLVKSSKRFNVSVSLVCLFYFLFDYYTLSLNIARQFAAVSILLYAYSFLQYKDKRNLWFFVFVILASGFHIISIVFIVLYLTRYFNAVEINKWFIIVFGFAFYVFCFFWVEKLIEPIKNVLSNYNYYVYYLDQIKVLPITFAGIIFSTSIFIINMVIFVQLQKEGVNKNLLNLFLISIFVSTLFVNLYGNIGRIKYSMAIINVIIYAYYFKQNRLSLSFSQYKIIMFTVILTVYSYILVHGMSVNSYGQVPYYLNF